MFALLEREVKLPYDKYVPLKSVKSQRWKQWTMVSICSQGIHALCTLNDDPKTGSRVGQLHSV